MMVLIGNGMYSSSRKKSLSHPRAPKLYLPVWRSPDRELLHLGTSSCHCNTPERTTTQKPQGTDKKNLSTQLLRDSPGVGDDVPVEIPRVFPACFRGPIHMPKQMPTLFCGVFAAYGTIAVLGELDHSSSCC